MRLAGGGEVRLDADVELLRADPEPDSATASEPLRLLELLESEQVAEEAARVGLAARRGGELDCTDDYLSCQNELIPRRYADSPF